MEKLFLIFILFLPLFSAAPMQLSLGDEIFYKLVDDNNDGIMSVQEFERGLQSLMKGLSAVSDALSGTEKGREYEEGFRKSVSPKEVDKYDKNGDGRVTLDEILQQMRVVARKADTDGDGTISKEEYIKSVVIDKLE